MNIARIYLRVSTDEQDLTRQATIERDARLAGYYIAGIYRETALRASHRIADFPVLASLAKGRTKAIRLDGRACLHLYAEAGATLDVSLLPEHELTFVRSLGLESTDYA